MSPDEIILYPTKPRGEWHRPDYDAHAQLRKACEPVTPEELVDNEFHVRCSELFELAVKTRAAGIAASQVGWFKRVYVLCEHPDVVEVPTVGAVTLGESKGIIFVNPEIVSMEGSVVEPEGCLSFPGLVWPMRGPAKTKVAFDLFNGERVEHVLEGYSARGAMHEGDHLDGKLLIDRLSPWQRAMFLRAYGKANSKRRVA